MGALADPGQEGRGQRVARHGEGVARRGDHPGVGHRDQRDHGGRGHDEHSDVLHEELGGGRHRSRRRGEQFGRRDANHHGDDRRVEEHHEPDREQHARRDGAARTPHFFGHRSHLGHSRIGDEHEAGGRQQTLDAVGQERVECVGIDRRDAAGDEGEQHQQHPCDEQHLETGGLFDPDEVETDQHEGDGGGDQALLVVEEELEIRRQADQGECGLEHQREPNAEAGDRPHEGAHGPVDIQVGTAGLGHGGRHFRLRQCGRDHDEPSEEEGEHDGGTGDLEAEAGQDEDPGADHRPDRDHHHGVEPEAPLQRSRGDGLGGWGVAGGHGRYKIPNRPALPREERRHAAGYAPPGPPQRRPVTARLRRSRRTLRETGWRGETIR